VVACSSEYQSVSEMRQSWEGCRYIENTLFEIERRQRLFLRNFDGGNILHFLRHFFPTYFAGFEVSDNQRWEKILKRIEKVASARIQDASDLRYGDVLVGEPSQALLSIYIGHGVIASYGEEGIHYKPLGNDYTAAYRLIPAFGACDYRPDSENFLRDVTLLR
jgi:hypothetical protein